MNLDSVRAFLNNFSALDTNNIEVVICPSAIHIPIVRDYNLSHISIGAQDCSIFQDLGSKTGEVCASMLAEFGVKYIILGHCERRSMGETEDIILTKIHASLRANIAPIICFGEDENMCTDICAMVQQKLSFLKKLESNARIIVAYEPVWSIGSGKTPDNLYIQSVLTHARQYLGRADSPFVYGGSVNISNAQDILEISDGLLIGGASLDVVGFHSIMMSASNHAL